MKVSRHPHRTKIMLVLICITALMLGIAGAISAQAGVSKSKKSFAQPAAVADHIEDAMVVLPIAD